MSKWIFIFLISLFLLSIRLFFFYQQREVYQQGQKVAFDALLFTEPITRGSLQRFFVRVPNGQRIYISTQVYPQYHYGEGITIAGVMQRSEKGAYFISFPSITRKVNQELLDIFSFFGLLRSHIITFFQGTLPPTSAGLLLGIVFGIREQIPREFTDALRSSGVLHVVAASGMNISIVVSMLTAWSMTLLKRQYAIIVVIPAVLFYAALAGFDPSIVRACIMGVMAITASLFGRQYFGLLALVLSAYVMVFIWPYMPFDIGFQLSFLATLGIIIIKPLLPVRRSPASPDEGGPFGRVKRLMLLPVDDIRTTAAAQITTVPVLLFFFGQYGVLSLFANAVTLWMVPILMVIGLFVAVASFVLIPLGPVGSGLVKGLLFLALPLLLLFESTVSLIGGFHADFALSMPIAMVVGYYLLLGAVVLFINKRKNSKYEAGK